MTSLLNTDILINSFVILFHFLNIIIGLTALFLIFKRISASSTDLLKSFFRQALFYNFTLILSAVTDFLDFFFWKMYAKNSVTFGFLFLINILSLSAYFIWAVSYAQMVYRLIGSPWDLKSIKGYKAGLAVFAAFMLFLLAGRVTRLVTWLYMPFSMILIFSSLALVLGHSILLYIRSGSEGVPERQKALKVMSALFICFAVLNILVFLNFYPLNFLPPLLTKFSYSFMDLVFNLIVIVWTLRYAAFVNKPEEVQHPAETVPVDEITEKFQISKREMEVIQLVCTGRSNQEIADELFISIGTVKNHLYNIYSRLGIKNRTQLVKMFQSPRTPA